MEGFGIYHPYSPYHPLYGCRLKLLRAEEHFQNLQNSMHEFYEREPYTLVQEHNLEQDQHILRLKVREDPPPAWSPIIGDIVHNMRSALDHLVWQLVVKNGEEPTVTNQFPIFLLDPFAPEAHLTKRSRDKAINGWKRNTRGMHLQDIELLKDHQPYLTSDNPESNPLHLLRELSNWDKHRTLHFASSSLVGPLFYLQPESRRSAIRPLNVKPERHLLLDGEEVARYEIVSYGPNAHASVHAKIMSDIVFGRGSPCEGRWLAKTLHEIGYCVSKVVLEFKGQFDRTSES